MKLTLQPVEYRHLSWLKAMRNNPEVMDFCRQPLLLSDVMQEEWLKNLSKSKDMIPFIVSDTDMKNGEDWVGYCAFSHIDPLAKRAECSYFVDPKLRGKGYGQEAIFLLLYYGFYKLGYHTINTDTFEYNQPEIEINKQCGFEESGRHVRHYFKRGRLIDSIILYITRERFDLIYCDRLVEIKEPESKPL